jgi:hypothetical protein
MFKFALQSHKEMENIVFLAAIVYIKIYSKQT